MDYIGKVKTLGNSMRTICKPKAPDDLAMRTLIFGEFSQQRQRDLEIETLNLRAVLPFDLGRFLACSLGSFKQMNQIKVRF